MNEQEKGNMRISEITGNINEGEMYPEAEFISLGDAVGREFTMLDYKRFENDKGEGVAILCLGTEECASKLVEPQENMYKIVTHSKPICSMLASEDLAEAIAKGIGIEFTVEKAVSKKTGQTYFYLN